MPGFFGGQSDYRALARTLFPKAVDIPAVLGMAAITTLFSDLFGLRHLPGTPSKPPASPK
jgi:hypothetical protein